jgi:hypothetical protein
VGGIGFDTTVTPRRRHPRVNTHIKHRVSKTAKLTLPDVETSGRVGVKKEKKAGESGSDTPLGTIKSLRKDIST